MEKVSQEIHQIHTNCGCDYLEDLLTAVFIAHTKVLTAIRIGQQQKKVEINIPKVDHFLFKVLCETAKLLWSSSYLFREGISSIEKQQNYRALEGLLNEGVLQAVRTMVTVKSILKDFVHSDGARGTKGGTKETEGEDEESDEEDTVAIAPTPVLPPAPVPALSPSPTDPLPSPALPLPALPSPALPSPAPPLPSPAPLVSLPTSSLPAQSDTSPTIFIDDKPTVRFGQFDSVFDLEHPTNSDMVYDARESDTEELDILDKEGTSLGEDDVDPLEIVGDPCEMDKEDYEELN
jgi:hypothetical protein